MTRIEDRLHHRLLQRVDPGPGLEVVPLFQRIVVGQDEIGRHRRLVEETGKAHRESRLGQRRAEAQRRRGGVRGVRAVNEEELDPPVTKRAGEIRQPLIRRAARRITIGPEGHGTPQVARHVVQEVDGEGGDMGLLVLGSHAARQRHARSGRKLPSQPFDRRNVDLDPRTDGRRIVGVEQ